MRWGVSAVRAADKWICVCVRTLHDGRDHGMLRVLGEFNST
jgi:hypothetical protein